MHTTDTFRALREMIANHFQIDPDEIRPLSRLGEDFGEDPIQVAELFLAIEDEWAIRIPEEEADQILTVQQMKEAIEAHCHAHA